MENSIELPCTYPVTCHTDYVTHDSTFVAIQGDTYDGSSFIPLALQKGASTIVVDTRAHLSQSLIDCIKSFKAELIAVENPRLALAQLSALAGGNSHRRLKIIGITGTKGKSTTSFLLEHILRTAGKRVALLSTVHNAINGKIFPAPLTTAQPDYLHQFFKVCSDAQVEWVVMEVAAQALTLHRVHDIQFDGAIFTNFSQEHAEFYPTMQDYFAAKCKLFEQIQENAPVIINQDDTAFSAYCSQRNSASISLQTSADYMLSLQEIAPAIRARIASKEAEFEIQCPALMGSYNGYNILAASAMALRLGIDSQCIALALQSFSGVPGRLRKFLLPNGAQCVIDYAHNPSSFEQLFILLRSITSKLIVVFGCGGNRDRTKRPVMGALAAAYADHIVLTTDNPRSEDPKNIMHDILAGIHDEHKIKVICELDRACAIQKAYTLADAGSIIALLGKGQEEYQIIGAQKIPYSDTQIVRSLQ